MTTTMERPTSELARYLTVAQAAVVCGVTERRVRNWQAQGLLPPATTKGLLQYRRHDVIRCVMLLQMQELLGQDSALAVEIARALDAEQIEAQLERDDPGIEAVVERIGKRVRIGLDPDELELVRERLATIPR